MMATVGFQFGDEAECMDCCTSGHLAYPIYSDTEMDTPTHCRKCEVLIEHSLTPDGLDYVAEHINDHLLARLQGQPPSGRACILRQWWEAWGPEAFKLETLHEAQPSTHELAGVFMEHYFKGVPTVDKYSPTLVLEIARLNGEYPWRFVAVDLMKQTVHGPFVHKGGAVAQANHGSPQTLVWPIHVPGEDTAP